VLAKVNLRRSPDTASEIVATIPAGTSVQIGECSGEWCEVTWNGKRGFAIARNLNVGGPRQAGVYPGPGRPGQPGVYPGQPGGRYSEGYDTLPPGPGYRPGPGYYGPPGVVYGGPVYYGPGGYYYYRPWRRYYW
jgi:hypothetical protein